MRAVVLVGGEGTRLRPLTYTAPKQMLPIVEQPMIERVIGHLADHGIDEAILSLGYKPDAFMNAYPDGVIAGVRLTYAVEPEPLDTAGAIRFAARHSSVDETFVVVNGASYAAETNAGTQHLICGQPISHSPSAQLSPKREDLTLSSTDFRTSVRILGGA